MLISQILHLSFSETLQANHTYKTAGLADALYSLFKVILMLRCFCFVLFKQIAQAERFISVIGNCSFQLHQADK